MKIHILFTFREGAWGGGNQFLGALRKYLIKQGVYEDNPENADVILFNSHHNIDQIIKLKRANAKLLFVHRIDGPIFKIRDYDPIVDKIIYKVNNMLADGTVFQSEYSKNANYELGMNRNDFETTILNAPDPTTFNPTDKTALSPDRKIRLVATSWSANMKKGFKVYQWLDENLDWDKYEMTFIGNSPIKFKNIKIIKPLPSYELAEKLKQHHIFITASQSDPCSNSLIEALHCGLPALVLADGGHPEIVGQAGEGFHHQADIPKLLGEIVADYQSYTDKISVPTMDEVGTRYREFLEGIYTRAKSGEYSPKKLSSIQYLAIKLHLVSWKIIEKFQALANLFKK